MQLVKNKGLAFYDKDGYAVPPQPRGNTELGAWFGSAALKANTVEKMRKHREQDQIAQGLYQSGVLAGAPYATYEFRGCLVGCTLPPMNIDWYDAMVKHAKMDGNFVNWHVLVERFYNIQEELANYLDNWFEDQWAANAPDFAVDALEAIPVGAIYSPEDFDAMDQLDRVDDVDKFLEILRHPDTIVGAEEVAA